MKRAWPFVQASIDAAAWIVATIVATLARYDFVGHRLDLGAACLVGLVGAAAQTVGGCLVGLYRRRYHYGAIEEVAMFGLGLTISYLATGAFVLISGGGLLPRSVPIIATPMVLAIGLLPRLAHRFVQSHRRRPSSAERIVVIGAGEAATMLITSLLRNPQSEYIPVAILDDDPHKNNLRIRGVRVEGTSDDIALIARRHLASKAVIAVPSASADVLRQLAAPALDAGLTVMVLPPVQRLLGSIDASDLRTLSPTDLLGRIPADIDTDSIASYLAGKVVLVTGAGGSIGSELCRQLHKYDPHVLVMLDRDETTLQATAHSIDKDMALDNRNLVLADIRDRERLDEVFATHRPDVVFHAAALKHLAALEHQPTEAWKTNVWGTQNVIDAALDHGCSHFINISTDKAADPSSVLGASKRIAERLTSAAATDHCRNYVSVRFGNVLGSRGSVLTTFQTQIAAGGPVTLTHADVTRYFMTVPEAVALTIQAGAIGEGGQVLVLDMGEPVRIADIAQRLIRASGRRIDVVEIGLRDGEKLDEVLLGPEELDHRPNHSLISQVPVPPIRLAQIAALIESIDARALVENCNARPHSALAV